MQKITVIGTGYVGLVSGTCFAEMGNRIVCCDVNKDKIATLRKGEIPIYEPGLKELVAKNVAENRLCFTSEVGEAIEDSDIVYIAVGTPMGENGEADMRYIKEVAKTIGKHLNTYKIIVNKSTVPVGTGELVRTIISNHRTNDRIHFDVVSNPEFLREGSAIMDCMNMDRAVIGTASEKAARVIAKLHEPLNTKIFITDLQSAEMIKYAANAFLATKISFINAIANICERVGADITQVSEGMGLDSRIGGKFLQAGIGYGGSCFPKDTLALSHMSDQAGYDFSLLKSVISTNEAQPHVLLDKLDQMIGDVSGKRIAVLGLAFKPNTDDMRCAPSLTIIPELLRKGAIVQAYDPVAIPNAKTQLPAEVAYFQSVEAAVADCDACLILTEWEEIVGMELSGIHQLMKTPHIVDGRNCFALSTMIDQGFVYHSIGRPAVKSARSESHPVNY
ncbi:UDP-glucose 6-dehydrogenase TuaD [Paenibacillus sp. Soil787]|uniref:UDP-glucose 6-dehydrogenase TuaD n=1 Tax=Paenibacillus sp. Soil787 TaxID=1736411 RepID=UPI000702E936|nr:UDP-glucose/GDP-mannose dehydrogenase family protein [Paenibacillus sp. Soil787]KRF21585.1 UDP-glucose 6-dehydrogenase [Paenibacillus sp. Soil787]